MAFGAYLGSTQATSGDFNASRLFGSLILINLLASPLIRILQLLPHFGAALGCLSRVKELFEKQECIDSRTVEVDGTTHGEVVLRTSAQVGKKYQSRRRKSIHQNQKILQSYPYATEVFVGALKPIYTISILKLV